MVLTLGVVQPQSPGLVDAIGRDIERQYILGDVHVSVVVDPLGLHGQRGLRKCHGCGVKNP